MPRTLRAGQRASSPSPTYGCALLDATGRIREITSLFGGQGTTNVPSWPPDSKSFAYVAYPV